MESVAFIERWASLFNDDRERLVTELYAEDAAVEVPSWGVRIEGRESILAATKQKAQEHPDRRILAIQRVHACDKTIVVEYRIRSGGEEYDVCAVLDVHDGKVLLDRSYR
jgi:hypothetical protein